MGIEICRDGLRMYQTVRWKAGLAGALIEHWAPKWFHFVETPGEAASTDWEQGERHPLVMSSLLSALLLAQTRY